MIPILTAEQMQQVDRYTIEDLGLPGAVLMESAGRAVIEAIVHSSATKAAVRPLILCGRGNNGGDGFVVARGLIERSADGWPKVFLTGKLKDLSGDAALMAAAAVNFGLEVTELLESNIAQLNEAVRSCDLVVDGLLGSGATGAPRGLVAKAIEIVNSCSSAVVAIDAPSGVEMNTGAVPGNCFDADLTVTFGCEKPGHRLYPGKSFCGEVICADIGFPQAAIDRVGCELFVCERDDVGDELPMRPQDSNKGDYGKLLVIGGSTGLTGAPVMSCMAAMAAGTGMVTACVPESLNRIFEVKMTEIMTLPLSDDGKGNFSVEAAGKAAKFIAADMDVVALGPGIGRDAGTVDFIRELASKVNLPVVLDADGLNAFAGQAEALKSFGGPLVLTPHPGEMARITGASVVEITSDPVKAARELSADSKAVVLLKGPPTVVANPSGMAVISDTGTSAMAKAGSGDVLTGVIAALLSQGVEPFAAAYCGAWLHGMAGELAAEVYGDYSLLASQTIEALGEAIAVAMGIE